jgi:hypothetical protein
MTYNEYTIVNPVKRELTYVEKLNRQLLYTALICVTALVSLLLYWEFEPAPLKVSYVPGESTWSTCVKGEYSFNRLVTTDRAMIVNVREVYRNIDGMDDYGDIKGEITGDQTIPYPLAPGTRKVKFDKKILSSVTYGRYEYLPEATYYLNPLRPNEVLKLPKQYVSVTCQGR